MSTRCMIQFVNKTTYKEMKNGKTKTNIETIQCYRHNDGYPDNVILDLVEFLRWNSDRNSDIEYTAANWIYYNKKHMEAWRSGDKEWSWDNDDIMKIGHGVCSDHKKISHEDIEYYYRVTCNNNYLKNDGRQMPGDFDSLTIECFKVSIAFNPDATKLFTIEEVVSAGNAELIGQVNINNKYIPSINFTDSDLDKQLNTNLRRLIAATPVNKRK